MNKILEMKFGSHLYGTNTENSDLDMKAIYLPEPREIILGSYKETIVTSRPKAHGERNTKDDIDVEVLSLDRYLELLCDGQTMALDMLFATEDMFTENTTELGRYLFNHIKMNRLELINRNVNAFIGYARQQAAKYGIKGSRMEAVKQTVELLNSIPDWDRLSKHESKIYDLVERNKELVNLEKTPLVEIVKIDGPTPNSEQMPHLHVAGRKMPFNATAKMARQVYQKILDNYGARAHKAHLAGGADYKALSHAVRVNAEGIELLQTGTITFPRPERELLLKIKTVQMPMEQVSEIIENGLADLILAQESSTLRDQPNREWAQDFVHDTYREIILNS
jgi:predicted nucleotidyltransferase